MGHKIDGHSHLEVSKNVSHTDPSSTQHQLLNGSTMLKTVHEHMKVEGDALVDKNVGMYLIGAEASENTPHPRDKLPYMVLELTY